MSYDEDNGASYSLKAKDKEYLSEPPQPSLTTKIPRISKDSRLHEGVRIFAPFLPAGGKRVQILGVGVAPTPEEATGLMEASHGVVIPTTPRLMKGPLYSIITDAINRTGHLQADNFAYTTVIPWLLPKNRRYKPKPDELKLGAENLHAWIKELKPECIIAFGKVAFDQLCSYRISADDARGGWFTYMDTNIPLYLADPVVVYITQPWMMDTLITDCREVNRFLHGKFGMGDEDVIEEYAEIKTIEQLEELVAKWERENRTLFSVDCEWAGANYVDGHLRSIQFCWEAGKAAYLNFFDENGERHLGATQLEDCGCDVPIHPNQMAGPGDIYTDYEKVGEILGRWLNRPEIRYIGHFFVADSVWMEHWLRLDVLGRCKFDTGYGLQTANEYSKLGLEVVAMKYTSFGRYDMELTMWKRANKVAMDEDEGYGKIPDSILVRYGMIDVDVVMRAYPIIRDDLERQNLIEYYDGLLLPFVTDTFHTFTTTGLPVDRYLFEQTRKFFNWAYRALLEDFRNLLLKQADEALVSKLGVPEFVISTMNSLRDSGKVAQASLALHSFAATREFPADKAEALIGHWMDVKNFNIRSTTHMRRWLFEVLGLTPVKTTKNAENGMPSMLWEKVLELPEKLQKTLQPAVDKETIEILCPSDETGSLLRLLAVSNVGNQCKGFLKEGEYDADGELQEEHGLAKFICSDDRIRARYSLTETGRPRTGSPNILNLSKYHNKGVEMGLVRVLEQRDKNPLFDMPEELIELLGSAEEREGMTPKQLIKKRMPSIRSVVASPDGWCQVESDFQTAEVRGLAFCSGDKQLLKLILGKDQSFGLVKDGDDTKPVRLHYEEHSAISPENRDPRFILAICDEGKEPRPITEDRLLRNDKGELLHPKFDMHWAVAEESQKRPRETMSAERDRGAGKVTRFSGSYGAVGSTIDRRIEAVTGIKPEPGTGQKMLEALAQSQPVATEFLDNVALQPKTGTPLVAASGRIRHFPIHSSELRDMPWRVRNSYLRAMGNEARNFYMQESVAATAARACRWLNNFYRSNGMKARVMVALYDAVSTLCPLEERFVVAAAHQLFMCDINVWEYHGRYMNYPIDTDILYRWSWKPTDKEKKILHDRGYRNMPEAKERELMDKLAFIRDTFFQAQPQIKERLNVI